MCHIVDMDRLQRKFILIFLIIISSSQAIQRPKEKEALRHGKICIGTTGRMSVPSNREHHYRNLRDRYTNCTYVDGNLELTWLQDENLDLSFLKNIREVTGYVLISHVDVRKIVLPSLQIVRGRTLFKLNVQDDQFALMVTLSKMHNLEMPALRDILVGSVGILNNYNLCHIKTIQWDEIITGPTSKYVYVYNFTEPERDCTPCHESCEHGCWGEGPGNCQRFSKINCAAQCHSGRCFGPKPRECCHLFCAGGCTGPKQSDCLACRNFFDDGVCKQECPPMQIYNPIAYRWEKNPKGKYAYGATCVKDCPEHLLKDNGACVRVCPPKKKAVDGECVPCDGPCPKTCHFSDTVHAGNIGSFQNCTVIEGSLTILDSTFNGFQQIYQNFTFGPRYPPMDPSRLDLFSTIKEVTGYINIQAHHPKFSNLSALRNLEIIGGRTLTEYFSALYIVKTSLESLDLKSLRKIRSGSVAVLENNDLCYAEKINWQRIMKSQQHNTLLQNNKPPEQCHLEKHVCDEQCSGEGCWGPGNKMCLSCKTFQVADECVSSCNPTKGLFQSSGDLQCMKCNAQCDLTCTGPGPKECDKCKNVKDGPFCVEECPMSKYNNSYGECQDCHRNCVAGCKGPANNIGPRGCNSCDKAIINLELEVIQCLQVDEPCPKGFFYEWVGPQDGNLLKSLAGKAVCRPCHPLCKSCNGYGFHEDVCQECNGFSQDQQCTEECSNDYFADKDRKTCNPCARECNGCKGPTSGQCLDCKNYKIYLNGGYAPDMETTKFNCTASCPDEFPYKNFPEIEDGVTGDPFCSIEPLQVGVPLTAENSIPAIIGGIIGCIVLLGIFLSVFGYQWRQRARAKENTAKMTMVMTGYEDNEPLRPTNIKPNLAKLRIVKEAELRKGGILGYGAFGTVYKGVWVPEGENVKIPVAIKVLREGTGNNANKEILEESYIMASLEHHNLLQLLAVCMTSQMMLVTQLMPLGCLLDYVRNNKDKIGSKPLLNWCTQIARGMAYLEEHRLVHRDLAARNVLVQTPSCVKITDFGLAKLLDINEDEYKAAGGKMPIKWLALECIQHRVFTHKSDVWAFGVTVWELLTYGGRPYENVPARDVPDLLEKGERLPQPPICTIDVYMIMIKCWMLDADSRPGFKELAEEFAKMSRDPGRFLVIPGDKLMRLPSYTTQDEKELIRNLSSAIGGPEVVMVAEEYLNPGRVASQNTLSTPVDTPLPSTPTQKFFPPNMPPPSYSSTQHSHHRNSRYGSTPGIYDGFSTVGSRSLRYGSNFFSQSCDPLKLLEDDADGVSGHPNGTLHHQRNPNHTTTHPRHNKTRPPNVALPVDSEDYLVPSPQSPPPTALSNHSNPAQVTPNTLNNNKNPYMDLISDPKQQSGMFVYPPPHGYYIPEEPSHMYGRLCHPDVIPHSGMVSMDNPEYILQEQKRRARSNYHTLGIPVVAQPSPTSSSGPSSLPAPPYTSLSSAGSINYAAITAAVGPPPGAIKNNMAGLNGAIVNGNGPRAGSNGSHPRSSDGESDHEYYNDVDRLKREMQPLHQQSRNETTV